MKTFYKLSQKALKLMREVSQAIEYLDQIDTVMDFKEMPTRYKTLYTLFNEYGELEFCGRDIEDLVYSTHDIRELYESDFLIQTFEKNPNN